MQVKRFPDLTSGTDFVESLHCMLLENYHELVLALPEKNRLLILDLNI